MRCRYIPSGPFWEPPHPRDHICDLLLTYLSVISLLVDLSTSSKVDMKDFQTIKTHSPLLYYLNSLCLPSLLSPTYTPPYAMEGLKDAITG